MIRSLVMAGFLLTSGVLTVVVLGKSCNSRTPHDDPPPVLSVPSPQWSAYYLSRDEQCTVLVDFSGMRSTLDALAGPARSGQLAQHMIEEFRRNGAQQAANARTIHLLAVYITGKDNYGRPDFANRTNLLKLSGPREHFLNLSEDDSRDIERLKSRLTVEAY